MGGLEIRRIFLGLGLAVSAYLLILAWTSQSDQIRSQRLASISETPIIESDSGKRYDQPLIALSSRSHNTTHIATNWHVSY